MSDIIQRVRVSEWVSVKTRLPNIWQPVIVALDDNGCDDPIKIGCRAGTGPHADSWRWTMQGGQRDHDVTHWMPLPPAPPTERTL